jgi:predicted O-methyltransferase YrrM
MMKIYNAIQYAMFFLTARGRKGFGIHSPYIFDLVARMFRNKTAPDFVCCIEMIRNNLINDKRIIKVNDLGAGPAGKKQNRRKVSEIAQYSAIPAKYGKLLSSLANEFGNGCIIELGTSFGISTLYMAMSSPASKIFTVEGCPESAGIARENFRKANVTNIELITDSFDNGLLSIIESGLKPGLVFIDGNHRKEPVIKYFTQLKEISNENTLMIFDDIYASNEMKQAWDIIKRSENVSATIDIFRMGIVFMKKGITNNNYKIRY